MSLPVRQGIQNKDEIIRGLRDSIGALDDWIAAQPEAAFVQGPQGRWSQGQHLDHLIRSVSPLLQGLAAPKFVLGLLYGTAKRPSMPYAELAAKYEKVLDEGGKASGPYVPPTVSADKKSALVAKHRRSAEKLAKLLGKFSETDLDKYGAKHPLIGWLTLRELLFFTIHHHDHHLHTLQRDYG